MGGRGRVGRERGGRSRGRQTVGWKEEGKMEGERVEGKIERSVRVKGDTETDNLFMLGHCPS